MKEMVAADFSFSFPGPAQHIESGPVRKEKRKDRFTHILCGHWS
jgi:hypothetical protein